MKVMPAVWPAPAPVRSSAVRQETRRPVARANRGPYLKPPNRYAHVDVADIHAVRAWVAEASAPTAIDLFCGAGGLSLGLKDAGFSILVGADSDAASVETHVANLGGLGYCGDLADHKAFLSKVRSWGIDRVDLVAGGVPCQPFSRAGRSKIRSLVDEGRRPRLDPRASLWQSFVEIVKGLRPRAVLLENVPDLTVWNDGAVLASIYEALTRLGYQTDAMLLNAFDFGVPQHRSRLLVVATRPGMQFRWPRPSAKTTVRDAISDLPIVAPAHLQERIPYTGPLTGLQRRLRQGVQEADSGWIYDHVTRDVRPDDAEAFSLMPEGGIYSDLPARLQRYRADIFDDKYKRLSWDGLSRSITAHVAKDGYWYIHPAQDRTLSVRETARIQTFPDWFRFAGHRTSQFRQIGNAVPPLLAAEVGRELIAVLAVPARRGRPPGPSSTFRVALLNWHSSHGRELPWRQSRNAWAVLAAERCMRRANPGRVAAAWDRLLQVAPTPRAFLDHTSNARGGDEVLGTLRAIDDLSVIADAVVKTNDGFVPATEADLLSLPRVGVYLASTVLVYGHELTAAILDRSTARVARRIRGGQHQAGNWQARLDLEKLAGHDGPDAAFNAAISDLANLVCRAADPQCGACPVRAHCAVGRQFVSG